MDALIDGDFAAQAGHVEDMRAAWRPHLFGETPNPLLFESSKDGGSARRPPDWGAGLAPLG
jgi:hypothetical protein